MHVGVVGFLAGGEAALVDAVVDEVVDPFVEGVDIFEFVGGKEGLG